MQGIVSRKIYIGIVAAIVAAVMAMGMSIGVQSAYAEDALPYGKTKTYTVGKVKYTIKNTSSDPGCALVKVKAPKSVKNIKVPKSFYYKDKKTGDYMTYKLGQINANAFKGVAAKTITLPNTVKKIKKNAFKGSKATKLVLKTTKLKKKTVKGSLKGSKIKTVKAPKSKKKAYKKIFTKKNAGKKVAVK